MIGLRRLNPTDQKWVLHTWLAAFGVLSLLGVTQFFHGWPRPQRIPGEVEHFHTTLFLGHHLSVASIFIFPLFVALDSAWNFRGKPRGKFLFLLAFGLGLLALFFTYSRTLWIALPLGLLVWVLWRLPKKWSLATIGVGIICGILLTQYPPIQKRIHDGLGVGTRQNLWSANWEFFEQRPLTGVGWRHNHELAGYYLMEKLQTNDVFSGHAHNNALDMLGGMGGLGLLAWIAWCGGALWLLLRKSSQKSLLSDFAVGLVCAWLVFQINGLTQVNFWEAKVQHQMAWIIAWSLL